MKKLLVLFLLWASPVLAIGATPTPILLDKGINNKDYTHVTALEVTLIKYGTSADVLEMPQNWQACVNSSYNPAVIREADLCRCVLYAMTDGTVGNPIYDLRMRCPNGTDMVVYTNGVR